MAKEGSHMGMSLRALGKASWQALNKEEPPEGAPAGEYREVKWYPKWRREQGIHRSREQLGLEMHLEFTPETTYIWGHKGGKRPKDRNTQVNGFWGKMIREREAL